MTKKQIEDKKKELRALLKEVDYKILDA